MNTSTPPAWAENLLRMSVRRSTGDNVLGDLLEEYRDTVLPSRGPVRADLWYILQVFGFMFRGARLWAAVFAASFIARTATDWLAPTTDFQFRGNVSTWYGISILLLVGFAAAWRSGSVAAGALLGVTTTVIAAVISIAGAAALFAVWHDPGVLAAIRNSGGLEEVFTLPIMMVLPGAILGTVGGVAGAVFSKLRPA